MYVVQLLRVVSIAIDINGEKKSECESLSLINVNLNIFKLDGCCKIFRKYVQINNLLTTLKKGIILKQTKQNCEGREKISCWLIVFALKIGN